MHDKVKKGQYTRENKKCIYYLKNYLIFKKKKEEKMYFNIFKNTYYILEFNLQKFSLNFSFNFNIRLYCLKSNKQYYNFIIGNIYQIFKKKLYLRYI